MAIPRPKADPRTPDQHKADFLERFRASGNVALGCRLAKVGRTTVYDWLKADPLFAESFAASELEATEHLEAEAYRRAVKGVKQRKGHYFEGKRVGEDVITEYSDTLLIFLLKGRAPEKYRERQDIHHTGDVAIGDSLSDEERERVRAVLTGSPSGL